MQADFELPKPLQQQMKMMSLLSINEKLPVLAKEGYYLSSYFIHRFDVNFLEETLVDWNNTNKSKFNSILKGFIDEDLSNLKQETSMSIPDRKEIIDCSFELYKAKNYIPLIPLILSQVDGIMKLITKKKGLYAVNHKTQQMEYGNNDFYVDFFSNYEQLNVNNRNQYELFMSGITDMEKLNRHSVLHGESTIFATELNAIKSILLLIFIAELYRAN